MAITSALRTTAGRGLRTGVVVVLVVLVALVGLRLVRGDGYQLQLVFSSAPVVVKGLQVQVDGFDAGQVELDIVEPHRELVAGQPGDRGARLIHHRDQ